MPRASRSQMEQHRRAVVEGAASLLRRSGPAAVTVSATTASAGLTVGAFYKQFSSKDALLQEAFDLAAEERRQYLGRLSVGHGDRASTREALIAAYLSDAHVENPQSGCIVAALVTDVARDPEIPFADAFEAAAEELLDLLSANNGDRERAMVELSTIVGAVILARATRGSATADELLRAVRSRI